MCKSNKDEKKLAYNRIWARSPFGDMLYIVADDGLSLVKIEFGSGDDYAFVFDLNTHESVRRMGRADEMLRLCIEEARRKGYYRVRLEVEPGSWMEQWYRRKGFKSYQGMVDAESGYPFYELNLSAYKDDTYIKN